MADDTHNATPETLPAGTLLSDTYAIESHIGLGGMAEVYRARNIHTDGLVAIKLVLPEYARDETILGLFKKEATILSHLRHDAIVHYHVFTVERQMKRPYLVMEFVDGVPLGDHLAHGPMAAADVRGLLLRIASGLQAAHAAGVVHRDLSPDNVILPDDRVERAKIIDFGIAKAGTIGGGTLLGGKFAGKYNYVSPEQLGLYGGEITEQSDVYALGLVAAAAALGQPIDMNGSHAEVLEKRRTVPDLSAIEPGLGAILTAMLQPDPARRLPTMGAVIEMLSAPPQTSTKTVIRPAVPSAPADPWAAPSEPAVAAARTIPPVPREMASPPPQPTPSPVFDPLSPITTTSESPFGPFVGNDAAGAASQTSQKPAVKPKKRRSMAGLVASILVVLVAGAGAYGYTQGWFAGLLGSTPTMTTPVQTPEVQAPVTAPPTVTETPTLPTAPVVEPDKTPVTVPKEPVTLPPVTLPSQPEVITPQAPVTVPETTTETEAPTKVDATPIDRMADRMAWLKAYAFGTCQYGVATSISENAMAIEAFGQDVAPFEELGKQFTSINGFAPDIVVKLVNPAQCALVDFLRSAKVKTVPGPTLAIDSETVTATSPLGFMLADTKGWRTKLFLVDDEGAVVDVTALLSPDGTSGKLNLNPTPDTPKSVPAFLLAISGSKGLALPEPADGATAFSYFPDALAKLIQGDGDLAISAKYFRLEHQ